MTASAKKDLLLRLNQLEHKLAIRSKWPYVLIVGDRIDRERREALAEGERIVLDWYQCSYPEGGFFWARERITINPLDTGRICPPGRCLEDVKKELNSECPRQQNGSCSQCRPGQYPEWLEYEPSFQARLHGQS